jgi:hypothetical protein
MSHWKGYDEVSLESAVTKKAFSVDRSLKRLCWWVTEKAMMLTGHWKGCKVEGLLGYYGTMIQKAIKSHHEVEKQTHTYVKHNV